VTGHVGVLLVHGLTGTPWEVRPVEEALAKAGHACSAPALPGHGLVPDALRGVEWNQWLQFVERERDRLAGEHGSVVLVGESLGALLALCAAVSDSSGRVAGVVTMGAALELSWPIGPAVRLFHALGRCVPDFTLRKHGGSDIQDPAVRGQNPGYDAQPMRTAAQLVVAQRVARAVIPRLRVPLLAIHGLLDATVPLSASVELVTRAGSNDRVLVVLPRSGHLVSVDYERDEVARQVCAFVARVANGDHGRN